MPIMRFYINLYDKTNLRYLQKAHVMYYDYEEAKRVYNEFKGSLFPGVHIELVRECQGEAPKVLESYTRESK